MFLPHFPCFIEALSTLHSVVDMNVRKNQADVSAINFTDRSPELATSACHQIHLQVPIPSRLGFNFSK